MSKVVYIAAGEPEQAAADLERLSRSAPAVSLLVLAPPGTAAELRRLALLPAGRILSCRPSAGLLLWARAAIFLGLSSRASVVCAMAPKQHRWLKFLALALPAGLFRAEATVLVPCSRIRLLRAAAAAQGPLCVVASASPERLRAITAHLRERYPEARLHGLAGSRCQPAAGNLFDSTEQAGASLPGAYLRLLPRCFGRRRFRSVVVPCTNEGFRGFKWLAWLLPVWRVEFYNEYLDAFAARNGFSLLRHALWRARHNRELRRRALPVGVLGSASVFSLKKIVPSVRATFPGVPLEALLPAELEAARGLFDAATVLPSRRGAWALAWKISRRRYQCWVIPCTSEPYARMKWLAAILPFERRHIYNELGDGFDLRKFGVLRRHIAWRLRERLSFQIIAATADKNFVLRLLHVSAYALRLAMGAATLLKVRLRAGSSADSEAKPEMDSGTAEQATVDVIVLHCGAGLAAVPRRNGMPLEPAACIPGDRDGIAPVHRINAAIRESRAEFICLLDSRCKMEDDNWLDRLMESFDGRTAQVGPQIINRFDGSAVRGGLLHGGKMARWNSDHAVCWHRNSEWLAVEALPWTCLVVRRRAWLQAGDFCGCSGPEWLPADLDFCGRLTARGWRSICNQSVTALYPCSPDGLAGADFEPAGGVTAGVRNREEDA